MTDLYFFPGSVETSVEVLGGKGAALVRMDAAGLPVPPGAILTVSFFEPWLAVVKSSPSWQALVNAEPEQWSGACGAVKANALEFTFDERQLVTMKSLRAGIDGDRFAVRSSSPEEDLNTVSFAGCYETRLGVARDQLEAAIRECFASSLDVRVLRYKLQHGLELFVPRIAVVIQSQVVSDVAGVGFSLNPLTNDYDEAVFDASWGLGESVVSGSVTPDHFVVDKFNASVLIRDLGSKKISLRLAANGGTTRQVEGRSDALCLDDDQLIELVDMIARVELLFGRPVDIEYAFADGHLNLVQARPITSWVPLPQVLRTEPGERRRLYMDIALSTGFTTNVPISPIGLSFLSRVITMGARTVMGTPPFRLRPHEQLWIFEGGRMYQDLSDTLWITTPGRLAKGQEGVDALMADTLRAVDAKTYRSPRCPAWLHPWLLIACPRAVWRLRRVLWNFLRALVRPKRFRADLEAKVAAYEDELHSAVPRDVDLWQLIEDKIERVGHHAYGNTFPALGVGMGALYLARWLVPSRLSELGDRLGRGFEGNVVVDMGIAMHRLVSRIPPEFLSKPVELAKRLDTRDLPTEFLEDWDAFVQRFGCRGPGEFDLGRPRYVDEPLLALRQVCSMASSTFDPAEAQAQNLRARKEAIKAILSEVGFLRRRMLRWAYRRIDYFGYTRDLPKHTFLMFYSLLRPRVLDEGSRLVQNGRLDQAEHIMGLTLEDLEAASEDPNLDLRARREKNTKFLDQLDKVVKGFPMVIDSRGRIIRPAMKPVAEGELGGVPISPGVARGPARVLANPDEKPVRPGDVLIAYTTDPGWTPLFVNAAAVVMEVGGTLQHGAIVAREYGKPCVAGIPDLLRQIKDDQIVEVDGTSGVVRFINKS